MNDWNFKKFTASDVPSLKDFFELRPTLTCDSTIFDTYLWKDYYLPEFTILDNKALIWRMTSDGEQFISLPLCPASDLADYFERCVEYSHEVLKRKAEIFGVDSEALDILKPVLSNFEIIEYADAADYLYSADDLKALPGKRFHKKKNHINAFLRDYDNRFEYKSLNACDKEIVYSLMKRWEQTKTDDVGHHLRAEFIGLEETFPHFEALDTKAGGIFIDGQLEAFSVGTYNKARRMAIIHIEKANPNIRGLYPYINQQFLIHEFPDAMLVNREDDMGIPGLRKAKESYHPIDMVSKFVITEK